MKGMQSHTACLSDSLASLTIKYCLLQQRANAQNVSYTANPTGKNIPYQPLSIKPIFCLLGYAEKNVFFKTHLPDLFIKVICLDETSLHGANLVA